MQRSGAKPDHVTLVSVLPACARLGALEMGRWIHAFADRNSLLGETQVCNALVEMYSKCGSLREARQMFDRMPRRDVVSWSAMIGGLAHHGRARPWSCSRP
ncbi:unnamed protein product [Spirodela intermedia]|uniref:Uncharacterized protein n=1 Tax=Spirodela intermedia TaxID=51605 RepID=A0A7I8J2Z5_SPIIN|nr:unnamed protein product [Spirodela intermedia]CAA6663771.1 unnamed protein product [Spirodela intermedia]